MAKDFDPISAAAVEALWIHYVEAKAKVDEHEATIARLHDLVAKFQRGGVSTLYQEGKA